MSKTENNKNLHETIIGRVLDTLTPVICIFNLVISIITLYFLISSVSLIRSELKPDTMRSETGSSSSTVLIPASSTASTNS